jgi:hypothetical protein
MAAKREVTRMRVRYNVDVDFRFPSDMDPLKVIERARKLIQWDSITLEMDMVQPRPQVDRILRQSRAVEDWEDPDE